MRTHFLRKALLGSISALTILPAGTAFAQQLDEVVVTARRTAENVMNVPIAITAVNAQTIEQRGITNVVELSQFTPGMFANISNQGNGHMDRETRHISFRGLTTDSAQASIFIDGAPYGGGGEPLITDVARVEVLKGPQSVYFGRSTFSGAINYVTKDPTNDFTGQASQELYTYGGAITNISASGPIIPDKLTFRAALRRYHFGGYFKDGVDGEQLGAQNTDSATLAIVATPVDHLKIHAYYSYAHDHDGAPVEATIKSAGPGVILNSQLGGTGGKYWSGAIPNLTAIQSAPGNISCGCLIDQTNVTELLNDVRGWPLAFNPQGTTFGVNRVTQSANLRADYDFAGGWTIGSILSYDNTKYNYLVDQELRNEYLVPNPNFGTVAFAPPTLRQAGLNMDVQKDFSVEGRITSPQDKWIRATAGGNLYTFQDEGMTNFNINTNGRAGNAMVKSTVYTPAVFGGLYIDVTHKLTASLEGRYQWDGISQQQVYPAFSPRLKQTYTSFSPRASLDYQVTPDQKAYVTVSRGYRPGGFNAALQGLTTSDYAALTKLGVSTNLGYDQEQLDNYEVGLKGTWFDKRLRTVLAAYYMDWTDGQVSNSVTFASSTGNKSLSVIQNAGSVHMKGVELELDALITRKISLNASINYEKPIYHQYIFAPNGPKIDNSTNVTGHVLEQTPEWTWAVSPEYKDHLTEKWDWYARLDYTHRGRIYVDATNVAWLSPRNLFDLRAGLVSGPLSFDFYVKNLFNNKQMDEAVRGGDQVYSASGACPPCYTDAAPQKLLGGAVLNEIRLGLPAPRTFGVKASYDF